MRRESESRCYRDPADTDRRVRRLVDQGVTQSDAIRERLGLSQQSLTSSLRRLNITLKGRGYSLASGEP